ncbi:MAG TPA: hypothetical protein EYO17_11250 [Dehalococcoidia bacterium]|nr:hypothetical protein [Dehalococcoidia bacterium]
MTVGAGVGAGVSVGVLKGIGVEGNEVAVGTGVGVRVGSAVAVGFADIVAGKRASVVEPGVGAEITVGTADATVG